MIAWIYARDQNWLIGKDGDIPWESKRDMKHFKDTTYGSAVVMGRKTFDSLGRVPLKGRYNFVITRDKDYSVPDGVTVLNDITEIKNIKHSNIFIIGGAEIYKQTYNIIDKIYETVVMTWDNNGDAFMYKWKENGFDEWYCNSAKIEKEENIHIMFCEWERKSGFEKRKI